MTDQSVMAQPTRLHVPLPTTTFADGEVVALRAGGSNLDAGGRSSLLAKLRAGEMPMRMELDAVTYVQRSTPNRNYVRIADDKLAAVAASFVGAPVLRDHNSDNLKARAGTVKASVLDVQADGSKAFRQTLELVKPWAMEAALDGTLDRFSIGFRRTGAIVCSVCNAEYARGFFGMYPKCDHMPGDLCAVGEGQTRVAEMLYTNAEGLETSAVSVPAVAGTGIEDIRASLSAARAEHLGLAQGKDPKMSKFALIVAALALPQEATEEQAVTAIESLQGKLEASQVALAAEKSRADGAEGRLAAIETEARKARVDALVKQAVADGKIVLKHDESGAAVEGKVEKAIRKLAAQDLAAAEEFVADLPRATPAGAPARSTTPDPTPKAAGSLSAIERKIIAQTGITEEAFLANKAKRAAEAAQDNEEN